MTMEEVQYTPLHTDPESKKSSGISKKIVITAISFILAISIVLMMPRETLIGKGKCLTDTPTSSSDTYTFTPGIIKDKVAVITDTSFSPRHLPLIMHFHAVLGPEWPIVYLTTNETYHTHLLPYIPTTNSTNTTTSNDTESMRNNKYVGSAILHRAITQSLLQIRPTIPAHFDLTTRPGVNTYLSSPWFWSQLHPATHVLIFQTDAILCANAHKTVDDFLEYDFIGAPLARSGGVFNGGLSLRNRTMIMEILEENGGKGVPEGQGEDGWFSGKMAERKARLPDIPTAREFACEYDWHMKVEKEALGYHKIHRAAPGWVGEVAKWCPEIALAAPGRLR